MLMPKKVKYRKQQRGRMAGKAWRGSDVSFGDYGLKALEPCWLTDRQIEAARVAMTRFVKRGGKIWIRVFPDKPITKKPLETVQYDTERDYWLGPEEAIEYGVLDSILSSRQLEAVSN